jgi:phage-related protein
MPFIHIKSLPMNESLDVPNVIAGIAQDFSDKVGTELCHIHTTWEFFNPRYYAKGDKTADIQPESHYPLIVDLLTPDSDSQETITLMLRTTAESISKRANFPVNNIFINHRQGHSGLVFDDGKIAHW